MREDRPPVAEKREYRDKGTEEVERARAMSKFWSDLATVLEKLPKNKEGITHINLNLLAENERRLLDQYRDMLDRAFEQLAGNVNSGVNMEKAEKDLGDLERITTTLRDNYTEV